MNFKFKPPKAPWTLTAFAASLEKKLFDPGNHREAAAIAAIKFIAKWAADDSFRLRNPGAPVWHKLKAGLHGKNNGHAGPREWNDFIEDFLAEDPQIFTVEHDWAAAFEGATDFDGGSYQLPYDRCCFEFLLNDLRVCALARQTDGKEPEINFWASKNDAWVGIDPVRDLNLAASGVAVFRNIRAVCIALDAAVAYSNVVRVPEKMNQARVRMGKDPLPDYRIVKLQQRPRAIPAAEHESTGARRRLHFRRGHWRHFPAHKTWIKWTLVGDPDMAFVDKHYRA